MWTHDIDGPIPVPAALDAEGAPTAWRPEYHLNVPRPLFAARPELAAYEVTPENPARHYAGACGLAVTVFLRFADEAQAKAVLADCWTDDA